MICGTLRSWKIAGRADGQTRQARGQSEMVAGEMNTRHTGRLRRFARAARRGFAGNYKRAGGAAPPDPGMDAH